MATALTYPGVYIEEVPSGVRTVVGVGTSITAFVGYAPKGPLDVATDIFSFGEYERVFGGLHPDSELSYQVRQFFLGGGTHATVVRVADGASAAKLVLRTPPRPNVQEGETVLRIEAATKGSWGTILQITVDYDTINPESLFNLEAQQMEIVDGELRPVGQPEQYRNLSMSKHSTAFVENVVNAAPHLIRAHRDQGAVRIIGQSQQRGFSQSGILPNPVPLTETTSRLALVIDGDGPHEVRLFPPGAQPGDIQPLRQDIEALRAALEGAIAARWRGTTVTVRERRLVITSPTELGRNERSSVRVSAASQDDASRLLKLGVEAGGLEQEAAAVVRPRASGTLGRKVTEFPNNLRPNDTATVTAAGGGRADATSAAVSLADPPANLEAAATRVQEALRSLAGVDVRITGATVRVRSGRLEVRAGGANAGATLSFGGVAPANNWATKLGLRGNGVVVSANRFSPVAGDGAGQTATITGIDGIPPTNATPLLGSASAKTGIHALADVDLFNLLSIPMTATLGEDAGAAVLNEALALCVRRRAFLLVDPPHTRTTVDAIRSWAREKFSPTDDQRSAALYFPAIQIADPLQQSRPKTIAPSGTVAALYTRTDATRGVWKAPAGIDASLQGLLGLTTTLTDMESGQLNQVGINALRFFPAYGRVAWGARTLRGADRMTSEWKYVPVRRLALYIEESLYRGTQWVVFEPNDEPLWGQIRLNVGAFMQNLFRQGAFQGKTPREAYLVKCDSETTTQNDINLGIVNILVGFAPLKPAEFVVVRIQQMAGQVSA